MLDVGTAGRPMRFAYFDAWNAGIRGGTPESRDMAAHINLSYDGWAILVEPRDLFRWGDSVRDDVHVLARAFHEPFGASNTYLPRMWAPVLARIPRDLRGLKDPPSDWHLDDQFPAFTEAEFEYYCWLFDAIGIAPGDHLADLNATGSGVLEAFRLWCKYRWEGAEDSNPRQMVLPFMEERR